MVLAEVIMGNDELPKFISLAHKYFLWRNFDSLNELLRQEKEKKGDVVLWRDIGALGSDKIGWVAVARRPPKFLWFGLGTVVPYAKRPCVRTLIDNCRETTLLGKSKEFVHHVEKLLLHKPLHDQKQITIVFSRISTTSYKCTFAVHVDPLLK